MYTQFYGLREKPFSLSPDPRYLFLSDPHREALAHLLYGIEQGEGFISITGEVGTGKTTLCRTILQRLDASTEVAFIFNPQLSGLELVQAINAELGLPTEDLDRRQLMEQLNRFLLTRKREGRRVLLIIDEAQVMEPDALEQVRLLSNLETNTSKLIQIILIGQPELDTKLESPELRQLRQRISVRWRLDPLSASDTRDYVRHRLRVAAGAPRELFTDLALREIHRRARGVPRVINLLCDRALLAGYAANAEAIGLGLVSQTDREVGAGRNASARRTGTWLERLGLAGALSKISLPALPSLRGIPEGWQVPSWVRDGALPVGVGLGLVALALGGWLALDPLSRGPEGRQVVAATPSPQAADPAPSDAEPASAAEIAAARLAEEQGLPSVSSAPPVAAPEAEVDPFADLPRPSELSLAAPDLPTALGRSSPAVTIASSLDAVLTLWSEPVEEAELLSLARMVEILRARGFSLLNLRDARLETLAALDLPAVIVLRAVDGAPRYAAVTGLDGEALLLEGIHPGTLRAEASEIAESWSGEAFVPWRDFETLPSVLRPGASGDHVTWLQKSLTQLGVYRGPKTGTYDPATIQGVRALQERLELGIDGTVGPVTKIRLYRALPSYVVPVLKRPLPAEPAAPTAAAKVSS